VKALVARLALEANVPVSVVCGERFRHFLAGWGELARQNLHLPLDALLPPGREYVAEEAIRLGVESLRCLVSEMIKRPYISFVVDAVSLGALKFYIVLVARAGGGDLSPYPFRVGSGFEGRGSDHAERLRDAARALLEVERSDGLPMELTGITADGCLAQQNALDRSHRDFFMDPALCELVGPGFTSQLCGCHLTQTVTLHVREKCVFVNDMFIFAKELADWLNTRCVRRILVEKGMPVCPLNVKTRWTDMLRTVTYMLKYAFEIVTVMEQVAERQLGPAAGRPPATAALNLDRLSRFARCLITLGPEYVIVIAPFLVTSISMGADDASCGDFIPAMRDAATEGRLLAFEFGLDQIHPEALEAISIMFEDLMETWLTCNASVRNAFATSVTPRGREMLNELASMLPTLRAEHLSGLEEAVSYLRNPEWPERADAALAHIVEIARHFQPAPRPAVRAARIDGELDDSDSEGVVDFDDALNEEELDEMEVRDVPGDEAERLAVMEDAIAAVGVDEPVPVVRRCEISRDAETRHLARAALIPMDTARQFRERAIREMCAYAGVLAGNRVFMTRASRVLGDAFVQDVLSEGSLGRQFDFWLSPNSEVHGLQLPDEVLTGGTHEAVWDGVVEWCPRVAGLSMLAQRVLTVMASEAPVERLNNKLKRALGDYGRRMSDETLLARLRLMHDCARPGSPSGTASGSPARHVTRDT
jgi:hypothetical protein